MTRYANRKLKYSLNENFNLFSYVEWDRFVILSGMRVTLSYLTRDLRDANSQPPQVPSTHATCATPIDYY